MSAGYREFEFDLPDALLEQLVRVLTDMEHAPLNVGNLSGVPEAQGVYQLFLDDKLAYIGKTDAEAGLKKRLERHSGKLQHRKGLTPEQVSFKAVRIFVFTAMDLETQLIRHYGAGGSPWNNSGFGANDPGRNRDMTVIEAGNFDAMYPIDIDRQLDANFAGQHVAAQLVMALKDVLPYTFRFQTQGQRSRKPHQELQDAKVTISANAKSAREIITELTKQLPAGWQATAFRSHIILYREHHEKYPDAEILART